MPQEVLVASAGRSRYVGSQCLCNLDSINTYAPRPRVDQHPLAGFQLAAGNQRFPGGAGGQRYCRCFFMTQIGGLSRQRLFRNDRIFGVGAPVSFGDSPVFEAVNLFSGFEQGHSLPRLGHHPGKVASPDHREAELQNGTHQSFAQLPINRIHTAGMDSDQHSVRPDGRHRDVFNLQDLRTTISFSNNGFHGIAASSWLLALSLTTNYMERSRRVLIVRRFCVLRTMGHPRLRGLVYSRPELREHRLSFRKSRENHL